MGDIKSQRTSQGGSVRQNAHTPTQAPKVAKKTLSSPTPSSTFEKSDLPTRDPSSVKATAGHKKVRPRSLAALDGATSACMSTSPRKAPSSRSRSNTSRNTILQTAVLWLCASGLMVRPAKADLLSLSVGGGYSDISKYINNSLNSTLESHSQEKLHTVSVSSIFPFARNLIGEGPDGTVVMSSPEAIGVRMAEPQKKIQGFLNDQGIPYTEIDHSVNMADVHYDPVLDLLVIAHTAKQTDCEKTTLTPACPEKVAAVITAFGKPKNIIQLVKNPELKNHDGFPKCYDLDIFFHLTTNPDGKKVALIYQPCTVNVPAMIGMSQDMSTKNMMKAFEKLGIDAINISPDDFNKLAANSVSLEPGKLVFSADVSETLKEELRERGVESIIPKNPFAVVSYPGQDDYALHCVTANIPNQGSEAELTRQRRKDPIIVEVTPTPLSDGPTISSGDPPEGVKSGPLFDLGVAAGIASAVVSGVTLLNRGLQFFSPPTQAVQAGLDAELRPLALDPEDVGHQFGSLNDGPSIPANPNSTPRVIDTGQQTAVDAALGRLILPDRSNDGRQFGSLNTGPSARLDPRSRPRVIDARETAPPVTEAAISQDSGTGNLG